MFGIYTELENQFISNPTSTTPSISKDATIFFILWKTEVNTHLLESGCNEVVWQEIPTSETRYKTRYIGNTTICMVLCVEVYWRCSIILLTFTSWTKAPIESRSSSQFFFWICSLYTIYVCPALNLNISNMPCRHLSGIRTSCNLSKCVWVYVFAPQWSVHIVCIERGLAIGARCSISSIEDSRGQAKLMTGSLIKWWKPDCTATSHQA